MSSLIRLDPFGELMSIQRQLDQVFSNLYPKESKEANVPTALDMYETDTDIVVKVSVPGYKPEDLQITLTGDTLTIKGETKSDKEEHDEKRNYIRREIVRGSFQRVVQLPSSVVADNAKAEFENGELVLTVPKAEPVKSKTIQVKAK